MPKAPRAPLAADPESEAKWRSLPQNAPSNQAMPPAAGGLRFSWLLLVFLGILGVLLFLFGRGG